MLCAVNPPILRTPCQVKWVGYDENDNTWEPEENLVDCTELLTKYKEKHGLPAYHETFNRQFNWKEPTFTMTLAEVKRRAFKNRDTITSASQLLRDPPTKKRKTKVCFKLSLLVVSNLYVFVPEAERRYIVRSIRTRLYYLSGNSSFIKLLLTPRSTCQHIVCLFQDPRCQRIR
ncbi:hypothetical protein OESDEN_01034 [Oesophagostomum dentatum]|uniref:Chromo domain-containing protein n=1 Tax=Oesophagostomum dentatum TaxID=61180 RepID=A0A0B1TT08_OESDE|nr:hypothetical protein OESDEN_01034 [Oesophagostomum dentatum]